MERLYPRYIILHHTAGHDVSALTIDKYHANQGFGIEIVSPKPLVEEYIARGFKKTTYGVLVSIGYHYLVRAEGVVEKGRPDFIQGAHCKAQNMNFRSIGVALTGNFSSKDNADGSKGHKEPTSDQIKTLDRLLIYLTNVYEVPKENVLLHRDVSGAATLCPGDRFGFRYALS